MNDRSDGDGATSATVQETTLTGIEAMLSLSPDAVVVVAADGTIRRANQLAAELFHTTIEQLEGGHVDALVPLDVRPGHAGERANFHGAPSVRTMGTGRELEALRRDGTLFPVDISLQPVEVDDVRLVLAVVRDLASHHQLREANRELAADARTLREFVSLASHELRTPLTSVKGFAETLLSGRVEEPEQRSRLLERIIRNADRQESLLTDLLDLSRIQHGQLQVRPRDLLVSDVVDEIVGALDEHGITADVPALWVRADPLRLEQVLLNVTRNAVRYGAPPVTIHGASSGDRMVLTVRDEGDGVDAEFEPRMFEAFHQQSTGDRREAEGLGLGLFLSHALMQAMDGSIAYRRLEGATTCFDLTLPLVPGG